jgi:peptidyl-prolyl cis-trans isomerase A (cyclophilin A)
MKKISMAVFVALLMAGMSRVHAADMAKRGDMIANFKTNMGTFTVKLFRDAAPKTVDNFVGLANGTKEFTDPKTGQKTKRRFYDGLIFHRVIASFMIQGGDPLGTGTGGPGYKFEDEANGLTFSKPGILAMANAGPNTNGSQFFITVAQTPWLNGKHTIFGEVTQGYDVVEKISKVEGTPGNNRPYNDVVIERIDIETAPVKTEKPSK